MEINGITIRYTYILYIFKLFSKYILMYLSYYVNSNGQIIITYNMYVEVGTYVIKKMTNKKIKRIN